MGEVIEQAASGQTALDAQLLDILTEVANERDNQDGQWGVRRFLDDGLEHWYTILGEEYGEVGHAILEEDWDNYREELIQVAAVAVAAIQALDIRMGLDPEAEREVRNADL